MWRGTNNTVVTASQISGGTNLSNKGRGPKGYAFSGNVISSGSGNTLALCGPQGSTDFDLSLIGAAGSNALFQGFGARRIRTHWRQFYHQWWRWEYHRWTISGDVTVSCPATSILGQCWVSDGGIIGGNVTIGDQCKFSFGVEVGMNGPPLTIQGDLNFTSAASQGEWSFTDITHDKDVLMIEVPGDVNLNNVSVYTPGIGTGAFGPGTYGLIHADGSINGTPTPYSLPVGGTLQVNGNRLDLVVSS